MFGQNVFDDFIRFVKALLSNQIARFLPAYYVKMTKETGRGLGAESSVEVSTYFIKCFYEYFEKLEIEKENIEDYLKGKTILEYGPGDLPGVGFLFVAFGAKKVYCVDRFPLVNKSAFNQEVIANIYESLDHNKQSLVKKLLIDETNPGLGFKNESMEYLVTKNGTSNLQSEVDLVISRAVLEHVGDLNATFRDMQMAMKPQSTAVHLVDLKSHGLHRKNPLDFLTWPKLLWDLMYSQKGVPNRWRLDKYKSIINSAHFENIIIHSTGDVSAEQIQEVKPYLAKMFREVSDMDLGCLGFWLIFKKS